MAARNPPGEAGPRGLATLRRLGAVSDLLFLYEAETEPATELRTIAARLGVSVQAVSHSFRSLKRRGLVEFRDGRYRPTVAGVDWLHFALGSVRDDLAARLDRLHIVRTTRAVAAEAVRAGEAVRLEIADGILTVRPGGGPGSRGRAHGAAAAGELVDVGELEGIVPMPVGRLWVIPVPAGRLGDKTLVPELRAALGRAPAAPLFAHGLEAYHALRQADPDRSIGRFGVAAAVVEASRLGVDSTLVAVDRDLPRLFEQFTGPEVPPLEFRPLGSAPPPAAGRRRAPRGPSRSRRPGTARPRPPRRAARPGRARPPPP